MMNALERRKFQKNIDGGNPASTGAERRIWTVNKDDRNTQPNNFFM